MTEPLEKGQELLGRRLLAGASYFPEQGGPHQDVTLRLALTLYRQNGSDFDATVAEIRDVLREVRADAAKVPLTIATP